MRTTDNQSDPLPGLGAKVAPKPKEAPAEKWEPLPTRPDFLRNQDGQIKPKTFAGWPLSMLFWAERRRIGP
jgi:hypothetical protein